MIELRGVALTAGAFQLEGVDLAVPRGGYGVLMGRTGCGKTTLLEGLCGLLPARAGRITLGALTLKGKNLGGGGFWC